MSTSSSRTASNLFTLYFVRHGETEYNRKGIMQGRGIDSVLNETGRQQAEALAQRLSDVSFDAMYSSPLRRAVQTADCIAAHHPDTRRETLDDLAEMSWGVFEGDPPSPERDAALTALQEKWRRGSFDTSVEGGESILDVEVRGQRALRSILKDGGLDRTVLIVSHGRFLRVLLASVLEGFHLSRMDDVGHANAAVHRVHYRDGAFHADVLNCTSHLDEPVAMPVLPAPTA